MDKRKNMSYVDSLFDRVHDRIHVVERVDGNRVYREYPVNYTMYYSDPKGKYRTIYNTPVTKFSTHNGKEFQKEIRMNSNRTLWESDFNPIFRCLADNYLNVEPPRLHTCFFDIETDFHQEKGFAPPSDPFNAITAITVYLDWLDKLITFAIPPKSYSWETASEICNRFDNCYLFEKETDMLKAFLDIIEDADILSGWNSEGFDIPYTVLRVNKILSKDDTRRFCLWDQFPKKRMFERYGAENVTFDLVGRVHMDYMQLYRKYTYEERHSYSLDAIGEYELDEHKLAYEGTLDQLYNLDFQKFIAYNRQDTALLANLDKKLKFLDLANAIAHENTVLLPTTMGTVAATDQAIVNEAHARNMIAPNRKSRETEAVQAAGAYVAHPKKGIHKWIGSIDINSLYPSTIRALNMSPETIVGQLRPTMTDPYIQSKLDAKASFADAWDGLFGSLEYQAVMNMEPGTQITIDWEESKSETTHSAAEVWDMLFNCQQPWVLSANGTIFKYDVKGLIPGLLARWYSERKGLQAIETNFIDLSYGLTLWSGITDFAGTKSNSDLRNIDTHKLKELIETKDAAELLSFCKLNNLKIENNKVYALNKNDIAETIKYWNKKQQVKKLNLNGLYGGLLNGGCRFNDHRLGQSTTLTGRIIAKHMDAHVNETITGVYDHVGEATIYGDTDSDYFSAWPMIKDDVESGKMEWSKEICIELYDNIAASVNESFPGFLERACHCPRDMGAIIKAGREIVAETGLYIKKKRYAVLMIDKDGKRQDINGKPGKVKALGLDLKRSDTPVIVQKFLSEILLDLLTGSGKDSIIAKIKTFKIMFSELPSWEKGTPKRVNNLTSYGEKAEIKSKVTIPGHVRAALNWNTLRRLHDDKHSPCIVDGMKTIVCKLKPNNLGYTSVGYPTDIRHMPLWFKDLPFDNELMEDTIVDQKVENLLGVLGWNILDYTDIRSTFNDLFSYDD